LGEEEGLAAEAGGSEGGLDAGVAGAEDDYVIGLWVDKHLFYVEHGASAERGI
jgi:membrane carboxypeptidase/penicillin-binding protein PbpC